MNIVVLGSPEKPTLSLSADNNQAAFGHCSQIASVCEALSARGHNIIHVGLAGSNIKCSSHVEVSSGSRFAQEVQEFLVSLPHYSFVVCTNQKLYHEKATQGVPQFVTETCVGYATRGIWSKYRSFMSNAWMHSYYGTLTGSPVGSFYDAVIPPCFDISQFAFGSPKDDYFLMVCRLNPDKGIGIAVELAKKVGFNLKIAGPGDPKPYLIAPNIEYLGVLDPKTRNEVMGKARALFSPTIYIEPFGMVVVEANLCGTPVITTDFGAFTENVSDGVSGYRCRNWAEFQRAVRDVDKLDPAKCRRWGENYSYDKIAPMYERYFQQLLDLNKDGWYTERK